jgi:hypothetical protein
MSKALILYGDSRATNPLKAHKKVQDQLVSVGFLIACGLLVSNTILLIVSCRWGYGIIDVIKLELIFRDMPIVKSL